MSDPYIKLTYAIHKFTGDAFLVSQDRWIPFALVKPRDERNIKNSNPLETIEFNLRDWKAKQLGLL